MILLISICNIVILKEYHMCRFQEEGCHHYSTSQYSRLQPESVTLGRIVRLSTTPTKQQF